VSISKWRPRVRRGTESVWKSEILLSPPPICGSEFQRDQPATYPIEGFASSRLRTLPNGFLGNALMTSNSRGILKPAIRSAHQ